MKRRLLSLVLAVCLLASLAGVVTVPAAAVTYVPVTKTGQVVDSITYRGKTVNALYKPWSSALATDNTYGC